VAIDLTRAFGRTLAETEWLSPEDLRIYQAPLISKLLLHAQQTTEFYRNRFEFDLSNADEIRNNWLAIPILTRAEAVANREHLLSRFVPPELGGFDEGETSGSTGVPVLYRRDQLSRVATKALGERAMSWWKIDGAKPCARIERDLAGIAPPPQGATAFGWHSAHPQALSHFLSTLADVETQMRWLVARQPAYLVTYPPIIKEVALACQRSEAHLKFILVRSLGMVLDQETRDICRAVFGAEIADSYGAQEAGYLAAECPECGEYHTSAEVHHLEILGDDGSVAAPGEIGRVIVTSLYNYAMPLIRYEIGDLAEAGSEYARCGRGLPSLRRIVGRYRNVFRFRDGTIRYPSAAHFKLREFLPLKQMQVIQLDFDRIEIRWVSDGTEGPLNLGALTEQVRSVLQQPVEVSVRKVDVIERSPSGKFEDCISLLPQDRSYLPTRR